MENYKEISKTSLKVTIYRSSVSEITIYRSLMLESGKGTEVYVSRKYQEVREDSQRVSDILEWVT